MAYTDILDKLHPDLISQFIETGECDGIPKDIQLFLKQIQWASELYEYERNITRCAKQLHNRILLLQHISIDIRTCKARIYSAIDYFNIDCNISQKVWESNYADRYENLAKICITRGDYKTSKMCTDAALECRRRSSEIAAADQNWAPVFLINNTFTPEDLHFKSKSLKEIAHKHTEGFYTTLIDSLPIEPEDKQRLKLDAGIEDVESEEMEENEE